MVLAPKVKFQLKYFDRSIIRTNWKAINRNPLQKAGNIVRSNARQSIRRAKKRTKTGKPTKPRAAPNPPRSLANEGQSPPFKMIYSKPLHFGTSVIVGMVGFKPGGQPTPGLHEHGGRVLRNVRKDGGYKHKHTRKTSGKYAQKVSAKRWVTRNGKRRQVYITQRKMVSYPQRAFMGPALKKGRTKYPQLWKNSIKRRK